mgnify:CR=1 FL=1
MRRAHDLTAGVLLLLLVAPLVCGSERQTIAPEVQRAIADGAAEVEVIVHLKEPVDLPPLGLHSTAGDEHRLRVVREATGPFVDRLRHRLAHGVERIRPFRLRTAFATAASPAAVAALATDPEVVAIEPDRRWRIHTAEGLVLVGADELHRAGLTGRGTAVAILDTGIQAGHPALGGGTIPNQKVIRGLDTADRDSDPEDCGTHGTAVASIAAGSPYQWSPSLRFAGGTAPQARILAYKVSPDDDCGAVTSSAVVAAIEDALLHRQDEDYRLAAINLSFGAGIFPGSCDDVSTATTNAIRDALAAGVAVVASSGNNGSTDAITVPACVSGVLSVGSVWDTEPGWTGFSFCLDEHCSRTCNDSHRPAMSVTCYTNSGPQLDILAPSEYLTAARAGGQLGEFGGTSGAAPYVTGSIALLAEAYPEISPPAAGLLLRASGGLVTATASGMMRPLLDVASATDLSTVGVGAEVGPIPEGSGSVLRSATEINTTEDIGSVRVLIDLSHPDPSQLTIELVAPDGTRALLHDRTPGDGSGLTGAYPDDRRPARSLGVLTGRPAAGTWWLEVRDMEPDGTVGARLFGWAVQVTAAEPPTVAGGGGTSASIPVVSRGPGAGGTRWQSEVRIVNPSAHVASVRLHLVPSGSDGIETALQSDWNVSAGGILRLDDAILDLTGDEVFTGHLLVRSSTDGLIVTSRTFNSGAPVGGTFGQNVPAAVVADSVTKDDETLFLIHLASNERYRTNIGIAEVAGAAATVTIELMDGARGEQIGRTGGFTLAPLSHRQINRAFEQLGAGHSPAAYARVRVASGAGNVIAYASVIDNQTGDAVFTPGTRVHFGPVTLPVVARTPGAAGTLWTSDLALVNVNDQPVAVEVGFSPLRGSGGSHRSIALIVPPRQVFAAEDVIGDLLGLDAAIGTLRITPDDPAGPILASSRVANRASEGTYGQYVGGQRSGFATDAILAHLRSGDDYRTNVGLVAMNDVATDVSLALRGADGLQLGRGATVHLAPEESLQINDVFDYLEAPPTASARLDLTASGDGASVFAYASVIDAISGDAVFIPAFPR